ncbi:MAG TPA: hypothetical protein VF516_07950 [Kofleriaceae bacterium]
MPWIARRTTSMLAWQSEPELNVLCNPVGALKLRGVEIATWQAIDLPRKWGDTSRKPDKGPHDQLAAMFKRLKAPLNACPTATAPSP